MTENQVLKTLKNGPHSAGVLQELGLHVVIKPWTHTVMYSLCRVKLIKQQSTYAAVSHTLLQIQTFLARPHWCFMCEEPIWDDLAAFHFWINLHSVLVWSLGALSSKCGAVTDFLFKIKSFQTVIFTKKKYLDSVLFAHDGSSYVWVPEAPMVSFISAEFLQKKMTECLCLYGHNLVKQILYEEQF